jgi:hypothetical protein
MSEVRGRCPLEVRVSFDPCRAASPGIQLPVLAWLAGSNEELGGMILDWCDGYTVNVISLAGRAFSVGRVPLLLMPAAGTEFYRGLAGVIVGGMLVSAVCTLLLPALLRSGETSSLRAVFESVILSPVSAGCRSQVAVDPDINQRQASRDSNAQVPPAIQPAMISVGQ